VHSKIGNFIIIIIHQDIGLCDTGTDYMIVKDCRVMCWSDKCLRRAWCNVQLGNNTWGKWKLESGVASRSCSGCKIETCSLYQAADDWEIEYPKPR